MKQLPGNYPFSYPCASPPEPGTLYELHPGIFWIRMPLPFALDHINLWAIHENDGWTLIDTGLGNTTTQTHWQQLLTTTALAQQPINRIIVTHYHPDHLGCAQWLHQKTGAPVWINPNELKIAEAIWQEAPLFRPLDIANHFRRHGLPEEMAQQLEQRGNLYKRGVSQLPQNTQALLPNSEVTLNNASWQSIPGYGHSPEHIALYSPSTKILISGDMLLPRISTNVGVWPYAPDSDPLGAFLDSLQRFVHLPAETLILPSHGLPFYGLHQRVYALQQHHQERLEAILTSPKNPLTAAELLPLLFPRPLDSQQLFFAMGEAIAHLHRLLANQQASQEIDKQGIIRYRLLI